MFLQQSREFRQFVVQTDLTLHDRMAFRIEVRGGHDNSQRDGFARIAFTVRGHQLCHNLVAGLQLVILQIPLPCGRQMATVAFLIGFGIQWQSNPFATVHGNMLLKAHKRQVIFGHRLQRQDVVRRQQQRGFLLIDEPRARNQVRLRTDFILRTEDVLKASFAGNKMHFVDGGFINRHRGLPLQSVFAVRIRSQRDDDHFFGVRWIDAKFSRSNLLIEFQQECSLSPLQHQQIAVGFCHGFGRQQSVRRIFVSLPERGDAGTRPRFDAKSLRHCIACHDAVFNGFIDHMDIGRKLRIRSTSHGLTQLALFFGECLQCHFVEAAAGDFNHDGNCFVFGQQQ